MLKFINKQLSQKELHEVQIHLLDCEFCSEAVEGLTHAKNPSILFTIDHQINQKIEQKGNSVKRVFMIAASILLFVFGGYYTITNFNNATLTNKNDISFQEPTLNKLETLVPNQEEISQNNEQDLEKTLNNQKTIKVEKSAVLQESVDVNVDYKLSKDFPTENTEAETSKHENQNIQQLEKKLISTSSTGNTYRNEPKIDDNNIESDIMLSNTVSKEYESKLTKDQADKTFNQTATTKNNTTTNDLKKSVPNKNRSKKETEAPAPSSVTLSDEFKSKTDNKNLETITEETAKTNQSIDIESEFSGGVATGSSSSNSDILNQGITAYRAKKYSIAIRQFDLVIEKDQIQKNRTEAIWYKSLSLIELNEKNSAIKLLEDLTHYNNEYSIKAEKKLKELK